MPRHFRPFSRRGPESPDTKPQDTSRVRNRLHALFNSNSNSNSGSAPESPSATSSLDGSPRPEGGADGESGPSSASLQCRRSRDSQQPEPEVHAQVDTDPHFHGGRDVVRSKTFPLELDNEHGMAETVVIPPNPKKQREAIKVFVVTWNMGDALPKGDLSVLFGQIPPYQPESPTDAIPSLPVENVHPYHIVVVAGQECPTLSGAPRGLGGGLVKGVTLRHKKDKEKKEAADKEKEKEREKNPDKEKELQQAERERRKEKAHQDLLEVLERDRERDRDDAGSRSPDGGDSDDEDREKDSSDQQRSRATSPMTPHTPFLYRQPPAPKGWSQMLDDYFCGPNARTAEPLPTAYTSASPAPRDSPFLPHPPTPALPSHPSLLRSASAPITPVTPSVPVPPRAPIHGPSHLGLSPSPLARSRSSFESSASSSSAEGDDSFMMLGSDEHRNRVTSSPQRSKAARPEIIIPNDEISQTGGGNGCYVHVVKERLLGMYLSIYVYKGCEHLVQGVDKDLVTAGLAGGRVGNKGGIGISLKLADHRFLFVNSHLAAHTGRLHARLSNIAKIKSELRLDCFLPKDDPRASADDITERFDTTFWCGDLNFRLELSRLHADWLIEQKKYSELLMWDQLRLAMKDPKMNPFPGFEEANIDFPCTFKYDVWKSVRATNREIRRTLKRRKSTASAASVELSSSAMAQQTLSHVPEGDSIEEFDSAENDNADEARDGDAACPGRPSMTGSDDDCADADYGRMSFESSRYTSAAGSTLGTEFGDDSDEMPTKEQKHLHRAFELALKEKTRHFLELVKMNGILIPSPGKTQVRRKVSARRKSFARPPRASAEYEPTSRRTSMSSFVSRAEENEQPRDHRQELPSTPVESERRVSMTSTRYEASAEDDPAFVPGSTTDTNHLIPPLPANRSEKSWTSSPPRDRDREKERQPFARRLSIMKRTQSTKSVRERDGGEDIDEEEDEQELEIDRREGVYDSSKKQRVPSWCDRVLWKAHVEPDPEPEPEPEPGGEDIHAIDSHTPFHRLTAAFSHLGGHLKLQMTRTPSMDPGPADRLNLRARGSSGSAGGARGSRSASGSSTPPRQGFVNGSADTTLVASPPESPDLRLQTQQDTNGEAGLIPAPKRASPLRSQAQGSGSNNGNHFIFSSAPSAPPSRNPTNLLPSLAMSRSGSAPGHSSRKIANTSSSAPSSGSSTPVLITQSTPEPHRTRITFDSPISPTLDRLRVNSKGEARPRSNSDSVGVEIQSKDENGAGQPPKKGRVSDGLTRSGSGSGSTAVAAVRGLDGRPDQGGSLRVFDGDHGKRARTISQYPSPSHSPKSHRPVFISAGHPSARDAAHDEAHGSGSGSGSGAGMPRTVTIHTTQPGKDRERENERSAFIRFLKDLPSWLHRSSGSGPSDRDAEPGAELKVEPEKTWRKGEVRCLHYGTIDDVGMRLLEGRSDHRPAIFAGAVYV